MSKKRYIDLHLHLDGAITPAIARRLAAMQGIELPADEAELEALLSVPADCKDLNDFLKCFALPLSLLQTSEALTEAVRLVLDEAYKNGVVYAEIRFAPQLHTENGMTQEEAVIAAERGLKNSKCNGNLILCCMRGEGNDDKNFETLEIAKKRLVKSGGVAAIDLAGAEALYPTRKYRALFERAKEYGVPFTIHAGEADGAESVRLAIEYGAARIGHGVRSFEDEKVLEMLKEKNIPLEMCPTSNRQTHAVEDMSKYPLKDYLKRGIKVTINTDDPAIERTTLADEFLYIKKTFGITEDDEKTLYENSVNAAFTTEKTKKMLLRNTKIKKAKNS
ncbi:MAG: adenosine deaminase [Firmicutes bacterium]|nr:adenosine deaminase [Bacillota bacterium]MBQ9604538.1 adenosine deaminase [Bacillota bacterium]